MKKNKENNVEQKLKLGFRVSARKNASNRRSMRERIEKSREKKNSSVCDESE